MHIITSKTIESRRHFIRKLATTGAFFSLPGLYAEALTIAPSVTQGPYYPLANNIPLDKDNDLLYLNDSLTPAAGLVTYLVGRVLDTSGNPVRGALVELWHADREGDYVYSASAARNSACDANFAGFGQFLTGKDGFYKFRTVKAGLYNGRTRHYHIAVTVPGQLTRYCTQLGWNETAYDLTGAAWATQNSNDNVFSTITNAAQKAAILLDYTVVDATTGAVGGYFDFVPNVTPVEPTYPGGSFLVAGAAVAGPTNSTRFKISIPAAANYTYEIYANPTLLGAGSVTNLTAANTRTNMSWNALPFSLTQAGSIATNKITASSTNTLNVYLEEKSVKGFYYVSFRVPGANTGTP